MDIAILSKAPISIDSLQRALKPYLPVTIRKSQDQLVGALPTAEILVAQNRGFHFHIIDAALAISDFIILAIPLNDETFNLINEAQFRAMKRTAVLVNVSRGHNVNREALDRALAENRIEGFGADVYWTEPADPDDPLLRDPRVFITPHIGAESAEAIDRMSLAVRENIDRYVKGGPLQNVVNG